MTTISIVSILVTAKQVSIGFYIKIGFKLITEADMDNGST